MILTQSKEIRYPDGSVYHLRAEGEYTVENNCQKYIVSYTINGSPFHTDKHGVLQPNIMEWWANHDLSWSSQYAASLTTAVQNTLYIVENCLDTRQFRRWYREADTPEKRVNRIMEALATVRPLVISAYPSAWNPEIKIEVWRENLEAVDDAIQQWKQGVTIEWRIKDRPAQTLFSGIIITSTPDTESESAA